MDKVAFENLYFERLKEKHIELLKKFRCSEMELEKFLVRDKGTTAMYLDLMPKDIV